MIPFNVPPFVGLELDYMKEVINMRKISGDGEFTKKTSKILEEMLGVSRCLLTTSGTSALDMSALLCNFHEGDEVILPSYTFTSTANCFALFGAKLVFVDIRPDTMNIDEKLIEAAITDRTKAVCVVHYAGVSCEMNTITEICKKHNLILIEDAAQALYSKYEEKPLGSFGEFACFSFHETKNLSMGEGGAIAIKNPFDVERAEIIREKGTDRSKFFRGQIDKYTWQDKGSSYLPSELNVAYLYGQLVNSDTIQKSRMNTWNIYYDNLIELENNGYIDIMKVPKNCTHNAHMFYMKCKNLAERTKFINFLKENEINSVFHYIPLHSAPAGIKYGRFNGEDKYTTKESERLVRLPLYYGMKESDALKVVECIKDFYKGN